MKTAISIPDDLFEEAEHLARRSGMSRSQLYVLALREYLRQQQNQGVTSVLDEVYSDGAVRDPVPERAALADLPREDW